MTYKNIRLGIVLFVLTALTVAYYQLELSIRLIAGSSYHFTPYLIFQYMFPVIWGLLFFVLVFRQEIGEKANRLTRMTIEAVFLLANILPMYWYIRNYYFIIVPSYSLILISVLFVVLIFEIVSIFVSKGVPASTI